MSIESLMNEAKALDTQDRRKLIAYLVALQDSRDEDYQDKLARKIDDPSTDRWLTIDEVEKRLREAPGE